MEEVTIYFKYLGEFERDDEELELTIRFDSVETISNSSQSSYAVLVGL